MSLELASYRGSRRYFRAEAISCAARATSSYAFLRYPELHAFTGNLVDNLFGWFAPKQIFQVINVLTAVTVYKVFPEPNRIGLEIIQDALFLMSAIPTSVYLSRLLIVVQNRTSTLISVFVYILILMLATFVTGFIYGAVLFYRF